MATETNNTENVSTGKGKVSGYAYVAPKSATAPTDATTALPSDFVNLGYINEDGLTNSIETDIENKTDWNGDTVLTVTTSREETFGFTLMETKGAVLKEVFGDDNVDVTAQSGDTPEKIVAKGKNSEREEKIYVFEVVLTNNRVERIVVPKGKVTEIGEITYQSGENLGYELTVTALPDTDGNTSYRYITTVTSA